LTEYNNYFPTKFVEIADQVRNDGGGINGIIRSPLYFCGKLRALLNNCLRHSELVSESPVVMGIAGQARNDVKRKNDVFDGLRMTVFL
jgi:hypothetical protein